MTDKERDLTQQLRFGISLLKVGDYNEADVRELACHILRFVGCDIPPALTLNTIFETQVPDLPNEGV